MQAQEKEREKQITRETWCAGTWEDGLLNLTLDAKALLQREQRKSSPPAGGDISIVCLTLG